MNRLVRFVKKPSVQAVGITLIFIVLAFVLRGIEKFIEIKFGSGAENIMETSIVILLLYVCIYVNVKGNKHEKD